MWQTKMTKPITLEVVVVCSRCGGDGGPKSFGDIGRGRTKCSACNGTGKITKTLPAFQSALLNGKFYPIMGATPWVKVGNIGIVTVLIIIFIASILRLRN